MSSSEPSYLEAITALTGKYPVTGFSSQTFESTSNQLTQSQLNLVLQLLVRVNTRIDKIVTKQEQDQFQEDLTALTQQFAALKLPKKTTKTKGQLIGTRKTNLWTSTGK